MTIKNSVFLGRKKHPLHNAGTNLIRGTTQLENIFLILSSLLKFAPICFTN
jgi:hypothetical protein